MNSWASILNSFAIVTLSVNCYLLTRWITRLSRRVLDLEYPAQAAYRKAVRADPSMPRIPWDKP